jgi:molybdate transport system substrate-binding protein
LKFHAVIVAFALLMCAYGARAQESIPSIVIIADSNLGLTLSRVVRAYATERRTAVALSLTDSEAASSEIAEGANGDVLITAREGWLAELKQQGLVDIYSETLLADDRLALVGPASFKEAVDVSKHFPTGRVLLSAGPDPLFVVGYPGELPEGSPSRELMNKLGAAADMEPYTVYLKDRKQMRSSIQQDGAFGLMLATDAAAHSMNTLGVFPNTLHKPVRYRAVVLAGEQMDEARKFIEFLKTPAAQKLFTDGGLTPVQ